MENKNIIKLDNNYYFEIGKIDSNFKVIDIEKISIKEIKKAGSLLLKIDFAKLNEKSYKKILKKLLFGKNVISKKKIEIGNKQGDEILLGYILNYDENSKQQKEFISGINAVFYKKRSERYNYIYDAACDYLDSFFYGKNLCDFKDNKCGEKRNTISLTGCCHHFKIKKWPFSKLVQCEYLDKNTYKCNAKCIGCKLFTCDYLEKKGIKFRIRDILLLDTFFNPLQKYFIRYKVFTPKEKVLKILNRL